MTQKHKEYQKMVEKATPNSEVWLSCLKAFWVGGLICAIGQGITYIGDEWLNTNLITTASFTSCVLIFFGVLLTGIGVYDRIGRYAGAGSIVPITGFANSVAAPAMEFRREGLVMGLGAKLFILSGPVLTYGISASVIAGIIYYILDL